MTTKQRDNTDLQNWKNRTIFHRDNLETLRGMNSETVDLIATDPPFKKGRDFHATPDSLAAGANFKDRWTWENDVQQEWIDKIADDWPAIKELTESAEACYGEDMAAFLVWMGIRLLEMRRVLKPSGSIYLHCDATAGHYLKMLMDAVFGREQFLGDIIWNKQNGVKSRTHWGNENDNILAYAKVFRKHVLNADDPACRAPFSDISLSMHFKKRDGSGRRYRERVINGKSYIYYADEGRFVGNLWNDISSMQANTPLNNESVGYPTQKPLALYERIIKAGSNAEDVVLDPFCGCATTCVAAERLDRKWVGIDIWDKAHESVLKRLQGEGMSVDGDVGGRLFSSGDVSYRTDVPERTDDRQIAAPKMKRRQHWFEDPPDGYTNAQRKAMLVEKSIDEDGNVYCNGCDRAFDSPEYLQLDHNTPRSSGGSNNISNRRLLCGPCNRRKSNTLTIIGLRRKNKSEGFMAG